MAAIGNKYKKEIEDLVGGYVDLAKKRAESGWVDPNAKTKNKPKVPDTQPSETDVKEKQEKPGTPPVSVQI